MSLYLDHNATTPVRPEAVEAMRDSLAGEPGNPSSLHAFGRAAARVRDAAREQLAAAVGCEPDEIAFTSGGTEADNLVLRGVVEGARRRVITAATEHEAVLQTLQALQPAGIEATVLPVDEEGRVDPRRLADAIGRDTGLVSVMAANNETGVLHPIEAIGAICREREVPFHTDAVQFFGKVAFRFRDLPVDFASLSAHKIGGPKGVGALIVRRGLRVRPMSTGGSQERRIRPGTENLPGIVGFATAARLAVSELSKEAPRLAKLRDRLESGIAARFPATLVNGKGAPRLPNTANVAFPGCDGETLLVALDLEGVAVSTGAACNAGAADPSHVLLAMGRSRENAGSTIRISLGRTTRDSDIDAFLGALARVLARTSSPRDVPSGRTLLPERP